MINLSRKKNTSKEVRYAITLISNVGILDFIF